MQLAVSRKRFALIGMEVVKSYPEIAGKILASHSGTEPFDDNLSNIPNYNLLFNSYYLIGTSESKRIFLACLISIYSPGALRSKLSQVKHGLATKAASVINCEQPYATKLIGQALAYYRHDQDFRTQVDNLTAKIKGGGDG